MDDMRTFYMTFGQRYRNRPHPSPLLPDLAADPDGWVEILAPSLVDALRLARNATMNDFANVYQVLPDAGNFPHGCVGTITYPSAEVALTTAGGLIIVSLYCAAKDVQVRTLDAYDRAWIVQVAECPWEGSIDVTEGEYDRGITWQCPLCKTWHGKGMQSDV